MSESREGVLASVGQRVNQERRARGITLAQLSRQVGISVPTLSKLENGRISLNFRHLVEIAKALNIPVTRMVGQQGVAAPTGRRAVTRNGQGYHQITDRLDFEILCDDLAQRRNIFWKVRVKSRSLEEYGELSRHPGEEFILVLEGAIDLHTDLYRPLRLEAGDSIHFDGMTAHAYLAVSRETPVLLISNTLDDANLDFAAGDQPETDEASG